MPNTSQPLCLMYNMSQLPTSLRTWHKFATSCRTRNRSASVIISAQTLYLMKNNPKLPASCRAFHNLSIYWTTSASHVENVTTSLSHAEHVTYCTSTSCGHCTVHNPSAPWRTLNLSASRRTHHIPSSSWRTRHNISALWRTRRTLSASSRTRHNTSAS
jgi:hypothetical protein